MVHIYTENKLNLHAVETLPLLLPVTGWETFTAGNYKDKNVSKVSQGVCVHVDVTILVFTKLMVMPLQVYCTLTSLKGCIFYRLSMQIREKISSHRLYQMRMRCQCWIAGACTVFMYAICMESGWLML